MTGRAALSSARRSGVRGSRGAQRLFLSTSWLSTGWTCGAGGADGALGSFVARPVGPRAPCGGGRTGPARTRSCFRPSTSWRRRRSAAARSTFRSLPSRSGRPAPSRCKPSMIRRSPARWPVRRRASLSATSPATNSSQTSSIVVSTPPRSPARRKGWLSIRTARASTRRSATSSIGTSSRQMRSTGRRSSPQIRSSGSTPSAAPSP